MVVRGGSARITAKPQTIFDTFSRSEEGKEELCQASGRLHVCVMYVLASAYVKPHNCLIFAFYCIIILDVKIYILTYVLSLSLINIEDF